MDPPPGSPGAPLVRHPLAANQQQVTCCPYEAPTGDHLRPATRAGPGKWAPVVATEERQVTTWAQRPGPGPAGQSEVATRCGYVAGPARILATLPQPVAPVMARALDMTPLDMNAMKRYDRYRPDHVLTTW